MSRAAIGHEEQNIIVRTLLFTMKMSHEEHARFVRVAKKWGLNIANLLRALVAREDEAVRSVDAGRHVARDVDMMHRSLRKKRATRASIKRTKKRKP